MKTILVIDDEADIREMLHNALNRAGYEVFLASDGIEGMKFCHS